MGNYRNFKLAAYFVAQGAARTTREELEKQASFFEKYMHIDKVYLEPWRSSQFASDEQMAMCREVLEKHGIEVAGGITTTIMEQEEGLRKQRIFDTFCYNDDVMLAKLAEVTAWLGRHFNEFIIDDFYFTNCTCEKCRKGRDEYNAAHGIANGGWQEYRLDLMKRVSEKYMIAPAKAVNPECSITIKYPNWAESYQETGYNPKEQRKLFDRVYTGTETRDTRTTDQHLPRYLSFSLMTYFENMCPGRNGGGWFDPFDFHITEQYLEQAYLTAFSKPKELMMFCWQALVYRMNVPALGFQLERLDALLDRVGNAQGVMCYLPDNCQGEDNVQDFLGMVGIPVLCTPYFPENARQILLTESSACDPDVVNKLERYVAAGGRAVVTSGFHRAAAKYGLRRMTGIEAGTRYVSGREYRVETGEYQPIFPVGAEDTGWHVLEFRNNSDWALVKVCKNQENFAILLRNTYGQGQMLTLNIPDSHPDLYKLPREVLTRIRRDISEGDVYLEAGSLISLFRYDNDTFIVYPYVDEGTQPDIIRIHTPEDVELLIQPAVDTPEEFDEQTMPVQRKLEFKPLYRANGEAVFEVRTQPGDYVLYKMVRRA